MRLPISTHVKFPATARQPACPRSAASGTRAMLPVSSSDPAITHNTRPSANTAPVKSVGSVPQISGFRPDETLIATRPPNAMYAPPRNPATIAFAGDSAAFVAPVCAPATVIARGSMNAMPSWLPDGSQFRRQAMGLERQECVEAVVLRAVEIARSGGQQAAGSRGGVQGARLRLGERGIEGLHAVEVRELVQVRLLQIPERMRPDGDAAGAVDDLDRLRDGRAGASHVGRRPGDQV